jgi:methylase of polypeptide subunit release factors
LVALLLLGRATPEASLGAAAARVLTESGLARRQAELLLPQFRVTPWDDLFIVHDPDKPGNLVPDTVLGVNNTTRTLAHLTPRARVCRALDLATGSAGPALRLAAHADTVVATDLSDRATAFALLNAAINDRPLDVRTGSLFEPVARDEPFDLITANLPFVISPDQTFVFRDGGRVRDELCREAVRSASHHLADGGFAVLLCSWLVLAVEEPTAPLTEWLMEHAGAAMLLHHATDDPEAYARRWNENLLVGNPTAYLPTVRRWVDAYAAWGATGIATGAIVLRRGGPRWHRTLSIESVPSGDGGRQLQRAFQNIDRLQQYVPSNDADPLLACRPALIAPHRLDQAMHFSGTWKVDDVKMILGDSAGLVGHVDPLAVHVLLRLDGRQTLQELSDSVSADLGIERTSLSQAAANTCRRLFEVGCLEFH